MSSLGVKTHASCPLVSSFTHYTVRTNLSWGEHTLIMGEHTLIMGNTFYKGICTKGGTLFEKLKIYPMIIIMLLRMLMIQNK